MIVFFFKQKTAYEMRISDWSSDVCSSDLLPSLSPSNASDRSAQPASCANPRRRSARESHSPNSLRSRGWPTPAVPISFGPPSVRRNTSRRTSLEPPDARKWSASPSASSQELGRASSRERGGQDGEISGGAVT